jgi:hypothetical protein
MARVLIGPSALAELRAIEPVAHRRRLCVLLSEVDGAQPGHRISGGGCCRLVAAGRRVLYRERPDGTLIITSIG